MYSCNSIYEFSKHEYIGFQTSGHAGYAPDADRTLSVQQRRCSSINTINAIDQFTGDRAIA